MKMVECCGGGLFVCGESEYRLWRFGVFHDGDAVARGQAIQKRARGAKMAAFEEVNGGARFEQQDDLRGLVKGGEVGDWPLGTVVKDVEIFAAQAFDKVAARVRDNDADVDAVDVDVDGLRGLLSVGKGQGN